jgi:ketosteroid isomerase-like protein
METSAPRRFAEAYVETVNRGEYGRLRDLFAQDATFLGPNQQVFQGRDEIGAFYDSTLPTSRPTLRIASYVEQGDDCVYELEVRAGGASEFRLGAIDHATLDEHGLVARFTVWTK